MHLYQQTEITATAAFEMGRATEGERCCKGQQVCCCPVPSMDKAGFSRERTECTEGKKPNKSAISHRQSNQGVAKHNIDVPAQTVSPTDSQSVPRTAAGANTAVQRALTIQIDLHILLSVK